MLGTVQGSWIKYFTNLVYPLTCLICKAGLSPLSDKPLCQACWNEIKFILPPFCHICGKHLPAADNARQAGLPAPDNARQAGLPAANQVFICRDCQTFSYFFKQAHAVCIYDGIIKECVHLFKYKSKLSLAKPLGELMINFARKFLDMQSIEMIIPVPLHSTKLRQRQFNQAELLAKSLSKAFSKELNNKLLLKIKPAPAQVDLSGAKRLKNVRGTFKVKNTDSLKNKNLLIVDDVFTTGATVNECAKMLTDAGANRVEVLALARSI